MKQKTPDPKKLDARINKINSSPYLTKRDKLKLIEEAKQDMEISSIAPISTLLSALPSSSSKTTKATAPVATPKKPVKKLTVKLTKRLTAKLKKWELDTPERKAASVLLDDPDAIYVNLGLNTEAKAEEELKDVRKLLIDIPGNEDLENIRDALHEFVDDFATIDADIKTAAITIQPDLDSFKKTFDVKTGEMASDMINPLTGAVLLDASGYPIGSKEAKTTDAYRVDPDKRTKEEQDQYDFDKQGDKDFNIINDKINKVKKENKKVNDMINSVRDKKKARDRANNDVANINIEIAATTDTKKKNKLKNKITGITKNIMRLENEIKALEKTAKDKIKYRTKLKNEINKDISDFSDIYNDPDPTKMKHSEFVKISLFLAEKMNDIDNKLPMSSLRVPSVPALLSKTPPPHVHLTGYSDALYDILMDMYNKDVTKKTDASGIVRESGVPLQALSFAKSAASNGFYTTFDKDIYMMLPN